MVEISKLRMVTLVCSARPRASTQNSRSYFLKTGESAWGRDVHHMKDPAFKKLSKTFCGLDCSEYLTIGDTDIGEAREDWNLCQRCRKGSAIMADSLGA